MSFGRTSKSCMKTITNFDGLISLSILLTLFIEFDISKLWFSYFILLDCFVICSLFLEKLVEIGMLTQRPNKIS
jgi:hypothetical protein